MQLNHNIMKKEVILILTALLLASATYAACDLTTTMDQGASQTHTINGRDYDIKFSSLKNDSDGMSVKFTINSISTSDIGTDSTYHFADLSTLQVQSISMGSSSVNASTQICFNSGLSGLTGSCSSNTDCDDHNSCTIDECDGDPLRCKRKLILWCRDDDGCCPESRCTEDNDNDCKLPGQLPINISNTTNTTNTTNPINTTNTTNATNTSDTIQTISADECLNDTECADNNACTNDICSNTSKKCINDAINGCEFNEKCFAIGSIIENKFCSTDKTLKPLKPKKEPCDNDYECLTELCIKNKCNTTSFTSRIFNWIKLLFSR